MMNDELKTKKKKKEPHYFKHRFSWRRTYIKISGWARTGEKYSDPTILIDSFVIQTILIFLLKTYAYKNQ